MRALLEEVLLDRAVSENSFALTMPNSSMDPLFPQNALLIFDHTKIPNDRDFVVVYIHNERILFNRLFREDNETYIKQNLEDGNVKLLKFNKNTDRIIGTLIETRVQY